ncbi:MAG: hypothetical protein OXG25_06370 [Gammaproteobacteria bacterium]|nr:hypothetical protein [Gammaproteobacteria bacterium]
MIKTTGVLVLMIAVLFASLYAQFPPEIKESDYQVSVSIDRYVNELPRDNGRFYK